MSNVQQLCIALPKQNNFDQTRKSAFAFIISNQSEPAFVFFIILDRLQQSSIPAQDGREAYQSLLSNISLIDSETFPITGV